MHNWAGFHIYGNEQILCHCRCWNPNEFLLRQISAFPLCVWLLVLMQELGYSEFPTVPRALQFPFPPIPSILAFDCPSKKRIPCKGLVAYCWSRMPSSRFSVRQQDGGYVLKSAVLLIFSCTYKMCTKWTNTLKTFSCSCSAFSKWSFSVQNTKIGRRDSEIRPVNVSTQPAFCSSLVIIFLQVQISLSFTYIGKPMISFHSRLYKINSGGCVHVTSE